MTATVFFSILAVALLVVGMIDHSQNAKRLNRNG
jgi:hypothetical protein